MNICVLAKTLGPSPAKLLEFPTKPTRSESDGPGSASRLAGETAGDDLCLHRVPRPSSRYPSLQELVAYLGSLRGPSPP